MKNFFVVCFLLEFLFPAYASNWHALGHGTNQTVVTIYIDSVAGKLYAGGQFNFADSVHTRCIAMWDGSYWNSMAGGSRHDITIMGITKYQNKIYADGRYFTGRPDLFGGVFDGVSWDSLGYGTNGIIFQLKAINNELWVSGRFSAVDGNLCTMIATWNGATWNCLNVPFWNEVDDFELYNNGFIIGGNFFDSTGQNIDIAFYDSSSATWSPLGGGLLGGLSGIYALQIYRGDLIVGGLFTTSDGNAGNNIMKWDGSQWHDLGGGTNGEVYCLNVYKDELYIGGTFTIAGGVHTGGMAKWDGNQWKQVSTSVFDPGIIEDIQFWNDELYVGGYFWTIDGDTVNNIAKFDGPLGINNVENNLQVNLFPNPTNHIIHLQIDNSRIKEYFIKNIFGEEIYRTSTIDKRLDIDISFLKEGLYFLVLDIGGSKMIRKFVKQLD